MKNLIAILRHECVEPSRSALAAIGIREIAVLDVQWQKRQNRGTGIADRTPWRARCRGLPGGRNGARDTELSPAFFPRAMLIMAVADADVIPVVRALAGTARAGCRNDGRIFVCPLVTAVGIESMVP